MRESVPSRRVAHSITGLLPDFKAARQLWILFACQGVLAAGLALSFPFLALYLHRRGMSFGSVGVWLSAASLLTALGQGLGGELADVLGRSRVMILSLVARAATTAAMAWAIGAEQPVWAVMGLHLLASLTAHGFEPASRSWIADHVEPRERHRAYGLLRIAINLGFAAGPALGGFLAQRSYALIFAISAAVCALCAAASTLLSDRPGSRRVEPFDPAGALKAAADPRFRGLCFNNFLISVAMAQLVVSVSIYATSFLRMPESRVGLLFSINGLMVALLQFPATSLLSRFPLTAGVSAGCLLYAAGFAGVGYAAGFAGMAVAMAVITLGEIFVAPGVNALAANLAPRRERGRYMGFFGLAQQGGASLGPLTGGLGLDLLSARWAPAHWLGVAAVAAVAAAGFHALRRGLTSAEQGLTEAPFEDLRLQ